MGASSGGGVGAGRQQGLLAAPALAAPCPAHGTPLSTGPLPQGQTPLPGARVSAPALVQPNLPTACALTAASGRTGPALPSGAPDKRPHCDLSFLLSQAAERITGTPLPHLAWPGLALPFLSSPFPFFSSVSFFSSPFSSFVLLALLSPVPVHLSLPLLCFPFSSLMCPNPAFSSFSPYLLLWKAHTDQGRDMSCGS